MPQPENHSSSIQKQEISREKDKMRIKELESEIRVLQVHLLESSK